jgi:hypothetical protein
MLHLEEALEELYSPPRDVEDRCDRRTPLVLTFDDGYRDNYTHAFALARELQIPIIIFLIPGYMHSGDYLWWREGKRLALHSQADKVKFEVRVYQLDQPRERNILAQIIDTHLCPAESVAERQAFLAAVREALAMPLSVTVEVRAVPTAPRHVRRSSVSLAPGLLRELNPFFHCLATLSQEYPLSQQ